MLDPRNAPEVLRLSLLFREPGRFLWRQVVKRREVIARYTLRDGGQRLYLRHRTPDLGVVQEVYVHRNYDPPGAAADIFNRLPKPLRAVDLGANIGLFSLHLLHLRPDTRIVGFEPDPDNAAILRHTMAANGVGGRFQLVEACASSENGIASFRPALFGPARTAAAVDVFPYFTNVDLIKIDIEGGEQAIMEDPRFATLAAPLIAMEYHPPLDCRLVMDLLAGAGYQVVPFKERGVDLGELWAYKPR